MRGMDFEQGAVRFANRVERVVVGVQDLVNLATDFVRRHGFTFLVRLVNRRGRFQYGDLQLGHCAGSTPGVRGIHWCWQRSHRQPALVITVGATARNCR